MTALATILAQGGGDDIAFTPNLTGFISLGAGLLIFAMPKALNYIVAVYLIVVGLILLFNVNI
jgi:Protein of unknown function (DUF3096)